MRNLTVIISISLLTLGSCKEITFSEPQPAGIKKLQSVPIALIGKYIVTDESTMSDTVIIYQDSFEIRDSTGVENTSEKSILSDSLVLKKFKDHYFINFLEENRWVIRVFTQEKNGDIILLNVDLSNDTILTHLKNELKATVVKVDSDTYYEVHPSPEPKALLKFVKDHYKEQVVLRRLK
jgi:hypothetical protein